MNYDNCGIAYLSSYELGNLLYEKPDLDISRFYVTDPAKYNQAVGALYADFPLLDLYIWGSANQEEFDAAQQTHWRMPDEYKSMDIAAWVLEQCSNPAELQRCGEELLLFQERDAFDLLRYMKYLVDTLRQNNVVWGVGRGSSVASFVLYKIGVHRINSLYYDLDPREFLK
jgi:hypothetical protein